MAEMAAAAAAIHLGADHAVAAVAGFVDRAGLGIVEARPAGAALKLALGPEQILAAADTGERARALLVVQGTASRPLRAMLAHDVELLGRKQLAPLRLAVADGIGLGVHFGVHLGVPGLTPRPEYKVTQAHRESSSAQTVRSSSSIETPCGPSMKQTRVPGRTVVGS